MENFCLADELAKQKLTLADINEFLTTELKARSLAAAQASTRCSGSSRGWTQQHEQPERLGGRDSPNYVLTSPFVC